ncbi:MAG TPA: twin-arginine translocation signal domain-containing protein, partial [Actinomycetota bacterium]|nr:twin-arginine translocation signal domain-containing protein [Actinomycetota bacterium]
MSRRSFLQRAAGIGAAGALGMVDLAVLQRAAWAQEVPHPVGMAMHVHSSFSEGNASMLAQAYQAQLNDVDVLWWTDHDWRMSGHGYRQVVHFSGLTESETLHGKLTWNISRSGSLASSNAAISSARYSAADPVGTTSLCLNATSSGTSLATIRATANAAGSRENLRSSLAGQSIVVDVFPETVGPNAFLEIRVELSDQPLSGGRSAGTYSIAYRIGGPDAPGTRRISGRDGFIGLSAPSGAWSTVTLTPGSDMALLWPDLIAGDSSMREISFSAGSQAQAPSVAYVDYLRFQRAPGDQPLVNQRQIMQALAVRYPDIQQHQGLEVSFYDHHINWFGSGFSLPNYGNLPLKPSGGGDAAAPELAGRIHQVGGLSSLNHPFGSGGGGLKSQSAQDSTRRALATKLIGNRAYGVDIIEAGYASREGIGVGGHLALWDAMSRNAIFLTG